MRTALVCMVDEGPSLPPLTEAGVPLSLLTLRGGRTLIRRMLDVWAESIDAEDIWVIAGPSYHPRLRDELGERIHVTSADEAGAMVSILAAHSQIVSRIGPSSAILLQPAEAVVSEEAGFRERVLAGLDRAIASDAGISFTADDGLGDPKATGIQAWPARRLGERLSQLGRGEAQPVRRALSALASDLDTMSLEESGWIDVTDWAGMHQALEYVDKPWGHECLWALNQHYAGKILFIRAGESLSLQYHERKDETIRIVSGRMRFCFGTSPKALETIVLESGMSRAIPPGMVHQMEALEDCTVMEVSTPHLMDVVRLDDRYGRESGTNAATS